ncbi:hypothetical protein NEUTE1DRAFT_100610 [Neurospora tetrasperma FGSC 2508]|uniref:Uncharacterized protein n=1 Tax=Neurospora tetrasperma (strain FGSC 2508 / ATCC MYA-4615 / P0657) TaxID=510951 RepID=F8MM35_NEUT8|nr:uncharacterized protein NEUTE1DRAFT_100610 [Neurospora tetrasperma FGSC 2508]EGO57709.1 hypothetical protein NEUTE1DRAFT_100610 [Neurospora tetrasperma FGSC 2508]
MAGVPGLVGNFFGILLAGWRLLKSTLYILVLTYDKGGHVEKTQQVMEISLYMESNVSETGK